eukprot:4813859-Prymnesium_polylepis.1
MLDSLHGLGLSTFAHRLVCMMCMRACTRSKVAMGFLSIRKGADGLGAPLLLNSGHLFSAGQPEFSSEQYVRAALEAR